VAAHLNLQINREHGETSGIELPDVCALPCHGAKAVALLRNSAARVNAAVAAS
jgi:hypothetical protein